LAISPPSDIVLDVARAAEPEAVASARAELMRRAQGASAVAFDAGAKAAAQPSANILSRDASGTSMSDASKKFEAMVLQTFISAMMPKNTEGTYGQGVAGDMWKSMMAEKLADTVAEGGGIGIADRLLKDFEMKGDSKVPVAGLTSQAELIDGGKPAMVATAFVDLIQRQLAREIGADAASATTGVFEN
jgi:Rod binding domain-containing protein